MRFVALVAALLASTPSLAESLQWGGFALLRAATATDGVPLDDDQGNAQVQLAVDWRPSLALGGHLGLLARTDADGSRRGRAGVVEAWLDQNIVRGDHRLRLMEGAFFLPTSRENVDSLWESPYTITSSALNSWLGEELRPIGVDAAYTYRRQWTAAATVFRGNDTFGALPPVRGWALRDHWALLGEHIPVDEEYYASVSAETDDRLGFAGRGRWNNDRSTAQLTYIDNRSDAREHGELANWATRFTIASADYTAGDWTVAAESGWGETDVLPDDAVVPFTNEISTTYVMVSRKLASGRVSLRAEQFTVDDDRRQAVTAAWFWTPPGTKVRAGVEGIIAGDERRIAVEARYYF
jgi:hypothetical protein